MIALKHKCIFLEIWFYILFEFYVNFIIFIFFFHQMESVIW